MDTAFILMHRLGGPPDTSKEGPHQQLTECATSELWSELVSTCFEIEGVSPGRSTISMPDSKALLLKNLPKEHGPWSLAVEGWVEPVHIHGVLDTSIHAVLPPLRAAEVIAKGWGEKHPYADFDTQLMIYAPRDQVELRVIAQLVNESVDFAQSQFLEKSN